jgi:hypothetical protein
MPINVFVRPGDQFSFELVGRSNYVVAAQVVQVTPSQLTLRTESGRTLRVPLDAVKSVTPLQTPGLADPRLQESETQGASRILMTAVEASAPEEDPRARVQALRQALTQAANTTSGTYNERLIEAAIGLTKLAASRLEVTDPEVAYSIREDIQKASERFAKFDPKKQGSGSLSAAIDHAVSTVQDIEKKQWTSFASTFTAVPRIVTQDRINVTRNSNNEFELPIKITLDKGQLPAENVTLVLDQFRNLKMIGNPAQIRRLKPGKTVVLKARMRDARKQGAKNDVKIDAHLRFMSLLGEPEESTRQNLTLRIHGGERHEDIPNPFRAYAGGLPVEKPDMFFGRDALIQEFTKGLGTTPGGMCYVLYGQQRTGKSSVLEQVKSRLIGGGAVVASMSVGTIDRRSMTLDFIEEVLSQFRVQVDSMLPPELSGLLLSRWPDEATIEKRPLRSFQRARDAARSVLRMAGRTAVPFVIVVDEFTYLHEILRRRGTPHSEQNELRDFMRQLKGLLEAKLFSALLVGQDTMPRFLEEFPNEFSVMTTRRLEYLTEHETQELADVPVRTGDNSSRYSGYALSTIATYTDGHPFFTQILCDRIITLVNSKQRSDITQSDVEEAVETLIHGRDIIEGHKFDCLVTADNTQSFLADDTDELEPHAAQAAQEVLMRVAVLSGSQNLPVTVEDLRLNSLQQRALRDLVMRGVLRSSETGVSIRVLLYADYLRGQAS